ncbi:hypothetical protein OE903_15830 [Bacillus sp. B6(2022)]|nr:hypothetical protein [Bacillus sp. B6(2022)]
MAKTMLKKWLIGGLDQWIMIKEDQAKKQNLFYYFYTVAQAQLK